MKITKNTVDITIGNFLLGTAFGISIVLLMPIEEKWFVMMDILFIILGAWVVKY